MKTTDYQAKNKARKDAALLFLATYGIRLPASIDGNVAADAARAVEAMRDATRALEREYDALQVQRDKLAAALDECIVELEAYDAPSDPMDSRNVRLAQAKAARANSSTPERGNRGRQMGKQIADTSRKTATGNWYRAGWTLRKVTAVVDGGPAMSVVLPPITRYTPTGLYDDVIHFRELALAKSTADKIISCEALKSQLIAAARAARTGAIL